MRGRGVGWRLSYTECFARGREDERGGGQAGVLVEVAEKRNVPRFKWVERDSACSGGLGRCTSDPWL